MNALRSLSLRVALVASVLLAVVPEAGIVLCLQADGRIAAGIGIDAGCPCPPQPDGTHPPCVDVHLDGMRDRLPPDVPLPALDLSGWLAVAFATPVELPSTEPPVSRASPRPPPPTFHATQRALDARRAVVLTI